MTKDYMAKNCSSGFEYAESTFSELAELLSVNAAYTNFQFKDGKRSKANIIGGCKFIILDIDNSSITDEECHLLLEDLNHHIARTSDQNNAFKFRILIELDAEINLDDRHYKKFIELIAKNLGLIVDLLPKSQIYFAYKDREVLSVTDQEPLQTRNYIIQASTELNSKPKPKKLTKSELSAALDDPMETFNYAYEAENGTKSRAMIRAALHAKDLGATKDYIINLMHEIGDYYVPPMPSERIQQTLISQINRWDIK